MTAWHDELVKEFNNRNNIEQEEALIGDVISLDPIRVSLFGNKVILTNGDNCYLCESLKRVSGSITLKGFPEHGTVTVGFDINRTLNVGDQVLCVPMAKGQRYAIVDRIL